jgi:hypothetical protein
MLQYKVFPLYKYGDNLRQRDISMSLSSVLDISPVSTVLLLQTLGTLFRIRMYFMLQYIGTATQTFFY